MKIVTGLFDSYDVAKDVVNRLEAAGFSSDDISIVSHHREGESNAGAGAGVGAGIGAAIGGAGGLLTGLGIMAIPGVGPVVAAGWLAATLAGAVGGAVVGGVAGGLIGALTESGVSENDAHVYAESVRRGGSLVTARVAEERAAEADAILAGASRVDLTARRELYAQEGWQHFDPEAKPYTLDEVERERERSRYL